MAAGAFGIYFDPTKTTSGQRFFAGLCRALSQEARALSEGPKVVLFNVSAPLSALIGARIARQTIVLRVDGLYFDRLSPAFVGRFRWPLRSLLRLGLRYPRLHDRLAGVANFLDQNYPAFARILLAHHVVYQSRFSKLVHERYFPRKPADVIVNGAVYSGQEPRVPDGTIRLVTVYDEWKPAKRIGDVLAFVRWAREVKAAPVTLTVLGYTGHTPVGTAPWVKEALDSADYVTTLPRFREFDGAVREALLASDVYLTFTYRDPCPNAVVEAMAHGLPVVALASGGVEDIVRDAGVLLPADDFADGFFSDHRFGSRFPSIDHEAVFDAVGTVMRALNPFRDRVKARFLGELDLQRVAERYARVLRGLAAKS
jgi:glycosyltransferase involved in cell wall biosynthesis